MPILKNKDRIFEKRQEMIQKFDKISQPKYYDLFCLKIFSMNSKEGNHIKILKRRQTPLHFKTNNKDLK